MRLLRNIGIAIACIVVMMGYAIYNGYPLVNPDTGPYIKYAFDFQVPKDRSPFYGVFTGCSSLWYSLWLTVAVQSAIVVFLMWRYTQLFAGSRAGSAVLTAVVILATCLLTHVGWVVSFVMPDIFTAILILSTILYFFEKDVTRLHRAVYLVIIFVSIAVHNSHYLSYLLLGCIVLGAGLLRKRQALVRKAWVILSLTAVNWFVLATLNYSKGFGFTLSAGSNVFIVAKLVETGILEQYLEDSCQNKSLKLCAYKDALPHTLSEYLWEDYSPLYATGGWDSSKAENDIIIHDVLAAGKYRTAYLKSSVANSCKQLLALQLPDTFPAQAENSSPYRFAGAHLPHELHQYTHARQYKGLLTAGKWDHIYIAFLILSSVWLAVVWRRLPDKQLASGVYAFLVIFIVLNAAVTATFSEVVGRLHYRVCWVLPFTNLVVLMHYYISRKKDRSPSA